MESLDPATCQEWMHLAVDGELGDAELTALREALDREPSLAREYQELVELDRRLAASRKPVSPELIQQVMAGLPAAGWEARHPRTWGLVASLLLLLGGLSAAMVGMGSAQLSGAGSFFGALGAVANMFGAAALAGAGMLGASWKGLGLALGQVLAGSTLSLGVFAFLVLCLNLLFVSLWRGAVRAVSAQPAASRGAAVRPRRHR